MDAYMSQHRLDAVVLGRQRFDDRRRWLSQRPGAGRLHPGVGKTETPDYPLGLSFAGRA